MNKYLKCGYVSRETSPIIGQRTLPDEGTNIYRNVALLNILVHDV